MRQQCRFITDIWTITSGHVCSPCTALACCRPHTTLLLTCVLFRSRQEQKKKELEELQKVLAELGIEGEEAAAATAGASFDSGGRPLSLAAWRICILHAGISIWWLATRLSPC